jgi:hypothetical protein
MMDRDDYLEAEGFMGEADKLIAELTADRAAFDSEEYTMTFIVATTNAYIETLVEYGVPTEHAKELAKAHCVTLHDIMGVTSNDGE